MIFLIALLFIEDTKLLLAQVGAEEAIRTTFQITREETVSAILTVIEKGTVIGIFCEHAFVQEFASVNP